jgi:Co/Zn/Cd efflux system component
MDCPAEEQMLRMKLANIDAIEKLSFDLNTRSLTIFHNGKLDTIKTAISSLNFGEKMVETGKHEGMLSNENDIADKKLLWIVLIINFTVFCGEIFFGFISNSMGLVADALDELSDAFVYGLSLYAILGTLSVKKRIARISGLLQLSLAVLGFAEVIRRFIGAELMPNTFLMIILSGIALAGNTASLIVLNKSKTKEIHIKTSQIFTSNDIITNIGVIAAAILVMILQTKIPDLVIGAVVFAFVLRGAITILRLSK